MRQAHLHSYKKNASMHTSIFLIYRPLCDVPTQLGAEQLCSWDKCWITVAVQGLTRGKPVLCLWTHAAVNRARWKSIHAHQMQKAFGIQAQMFSFHATTHVHMRSTCEKLYAVKFSTISYVYPWEFKPNCTLRRVKCGSGVFVPLP